MSRSSSVPENARFDKGMMSASRSRRTTLLKLLSAADIGVVDLAEVEVLHPVKEIIASLPPDLPAESLAELSREIEEKGPLRELHLLHGAPQEPPWRANPYSESRGTWALLSRANDLFGLLPRGGLLVLDEIDTSLHPDLCGALVDMFTSQESNPNGAQLLFTTHDRGLLSHLRSDEVLFVDKGRDGVSRVHTASDYKDVRTREDLRRAHEQGRLRGVPVLGDLGSIIAEGLHRGS